ncbi:MAG: STAS domain-containing protein [Bacteroidota bacterium]
MNLQIERKEKYISIELLEEKFLSNNNKDLKETILDPANNSFRNIILDINKVKYIDSSGLSSILLAYKLCKSRNGILVICGACDAVKTLIKISQLDSILTTVPTIDEARDLIMMEELEKDINA